jgi:plastocyanin
MGVTGTARYFWSPNSVKIAPGGSVTFTWSGGATHDVSIPALGFETKPVASGTYVVTFPSAGSYSVICVIHSDTMKGTVIVQ